MIHLSLYCCLRHRHKLFFTYNLVGQSFLYLPLISLSIAVLCILRHSTILLRLCWMSCNSSYNVQECCLTSVQPNLSQTPLVDVDSHSGSVTPVSSPTTDLNLQLVHSVLSDIQGLLCCCFVIILKIIYTVSQKESVDRLTNEGHSSDNFCVFCLFISEVTYNI